MNRPEVSVIMPAYNAQAFIGDAVRSLVEGEEIPLEIVIVDDGSSDATADAAEEMARRNPSVRLVHAPHAGVAPARNLGVRSIAPDTGFVSFLDADDLNVPGRITRQVERLRNAPDAVAIAGLLQYFGETDESGLRPKPGARTLTVMGVSLTTATFRRSVFADFGMFDETLPHGEDLDFYLRLFEADANLIKEDAVAVYYRRHGTNTTNDQVTARRQLLRVLQKSIARRRNAGNMVRFREFFRIRQDADEVFRNA